ncbi:hypothetical protein C5S32_08255 [ANME-1 cluster archaeon GoMg1]|nr:hypothetical protein [ANME-1 cluster archaeon GoMg1]
MTFGDLHLRTNLNETKKKPYIRLTQIDTDEGSNAVINTPSALSTKKKKTM